MRTTTGATDNHARTGTRPGAVVIGGHYHGLGLIRSLAQHGVPIVLLDHMPCAACLSRYVESFHRAPSSLDPDRLLPFLLNLAEERRLKGWVIYPTDDETVFFLSKHKSALERVYRVTTPEWAVTRYAYNKALTYRLAQRIGLAIPKTFYPASEKDLADPAIPFPAIVKPAVMRTFFKTTGRKVFPVQNFDTLMAAYRKARKIIPPSEILVQELIPDVSHNLFSFSPFFRDGRVFGRVIVQRIRQHPMDFGHATTYAMTVDLSELERLGIRILSAMRFRGICEVEFIRDPRDGVFKFLEVNPRIWGWHSIALRAGVNLPYLSYLDQMGKTIEVPEFRKNVKWIREITDAMTVLKEIGKGRLSILEVLRSLQGEKELAVFSWRDPLPFFAELLRAPSLWRERGF
jgi:predicted ATP-grasp superfamily ATP-dependent carboligase